MKKTKEYNYYECPRCNINTETKDRWCPCPRGGCEAELKGKVIVTKTIKLNKKKS